MLKVAIQISLLAVAAGLIWLEIKPEQIIETAIQESVLPTPTTMPTTTVLVEPTPSIKPVPTELPAWVYPGSRVQSRTPLRLVTSDQPDRVFDWYAEKAENYNLRINSKIKTRTNDNYRYVLAAAGNNLNIKIEITRESGATETTITVDSQ